MLATVAADSGTWADAARRAVQLVCMMEFNAGCPGTAARTSPVQPAIMQAAMTHASVNTQEDVACWKLLSPCFCLM